MKTLKNTDQWIAVERTFFCGSSGDTRGTLFCRNQVKFKNNGEGKTNVNQT